MCCFRTIDRGEGGSTFQGAECVNGRFKGSIRFLLMYQPTERCIKCIIFFHVSFSTFLSFESILLGVFSLRLGVSLLSKRPQYDKLVIYFSTLVTKLLYRNSLEIMLYEESRYIHTLHLVKSKKAAMNNDVLLLSASPFPSTCTSSQSI